MKKHDNGMCSLCKNTENIDHLLLKCRKENISGILREHCILYKEDFNIKSLLGVGCLQSKVYMLVRLIHKGKVV